MRNLILCYEKNMNRAPNIQDMLKNVNLEPILTNMMRSMDSGSDLQFNDVVKDVAAAMERANVGSRLQERPAQQKSNDVSYTLPLTIEELYKGKTKKLMIQRTVFNGTEHVQEDVRFTVATVPGMRNGQVLTFAGIADHVQGEEAADVLVTLSVSPHDTFTIDGFDLMYTADVSLLDAYDLDHSVELPSGKYRLRYKNLDKPLYLVENIRAPGLGMPKTDGGFGDLVVSFDLQLPSSLSPEEYERCEKSMVFDKRKCEDGEEVWL